MQALFERFRLLEAAWAGPRSAIFRSEFGRLCDQLSSVQAEAGVQERTAAPAFNIFYLLGVEGDEDKTHTPILADLLDPRVHMHKASYSCGSSCDAALRTLRSRNHRKATRRKCGS